MEEIDFIRMINGVETSGEVIKRIADFFTRFKGELIRDKPVVGSDYIVTHKITRLTDLLGCLKNFYLYDREDRYFTNLELRKIRNEEDVERLFEASINVYPEAARNFLVNLGLGPALLEIRTWYENYSEKTGSARLTLGDFLKMNISLDYNVALELIQKIRSI